jgi:fatty aldehyde-generating acyl-ACP reductase
VPPYLTQEPPWFTFLVHPRDFEDLWVVPGAALVDQHSTSDAEFQEKMLSLPPTVIGDVRFGFAPVHGEVVAVLCMPDEILHLRGRQGIIEAVEVAVGRGTPVIGLGALTAPATRGGAALLPLVPRGVTVTTGNAYTAAIAFRNAMEAISELNQSGPVRVAVVGCTGSVGVATARLLDRAGLDLILIGRSKHRVNRELPDVAPRATVSEQRDDIAGADVVLLLTGDPTAQLEPGMPRPGSIVIDLAHPFNIPPRRFGEFQARDIRVAQGGLVEIPGYSSTAELRLPDRHCTLACLAETYLFAREGIREHSVGHASVELAIELEDIADRYGVGPRKLDLDGWKPPAAPVAGRMIAAAPAG